jgi:hypothetical protein
MVEEGEQQKRVEEGRLYQEVKAMRHSVTRGVLYGQKTNYKFSEKALHAPFNDFLETLDEAQKEFPLANITKQIYEENKEWWSSADVKNTCKWFVKWFGKVKK